MRCFLFASAAIVVGIGLAGCVSETTAFHSPDGKYTSVCSGAGFGIIRGTIAMNEYRNCREAYLKAGYIEGPAPPVRYPRRCLPQFTRPG
jgi:hypothetical protein